MAMPVMRMSRRIGNKNLERRRGKAEMKSSMARRKKHFRAVNNKSPLKNPTLVPVADQGANVVEDLQVPGVAPAHAPMALCIDWQDIQEGERRQARQGSAEGKQEADSGHGARWGRWQMRDDASSPFDVCASCPHLEALCKGVLLNGLNGVPRKGCNVEEAKGGDALALGRVLLGPHLPAKLLRHLTIKVAQKGVHFRLVGPRAKALRNGGGVLRHSALAHSGGLCHAQGCCPCSGAPLILTFAALLLLAAPRGSHD